MTQQELIELIAGMPYLTDKIRELDYDTNRHGRAIGYCFDILYVLIMFIFMVLAIVKDLHINIQSTLLGHHSILITPNRIMLLIGFGIIMTLIYLWQKHYIKKLVEFYQWRKLELIYGTPQGHIKIKK